MKRFWHWIEGELPSFETMAAYGALLLAFTVGYFVGYGRGEWNRMLYEMDRRAPPKKTATNSQVFDMGPRQIQRLPQTPNVWDTADPRSINPNGVGPNEPGLFRNFWGVQEPVGTARVVDGEPDYDSRFANSHGRAYTAEEIGFLRSEFGDHYFDHPQTRTWYKANGNSGCTSKKPVILSPDLEAWKPDWAWVAHVAAKEVALPVQWELIEGFVCEERSDGRWHELLTGESVMFAEIQTKDGKVTDRWLMPLGGGEVERRKKAARKAGNP